MANELRDKGIEIANQAVQADNGERNPPHPQMCATRPRARARKAASDATALRARGLFGVRNAAQQYEDAINKYCKAAEYLLTALKYEKNPVTLKTIREKCAEYTSRAETLKKGLDAPKSAKAAKAGGGGDVDDKDDDDEGEDEFEPLTEEQLAKAEAEMEEELAKCVARPVQLRLLASPPCQSDASWGHAELQCGHASADASRPCARSLVARAHAG